MFFIDWLFPTFEARGVVKAPKYPFVRALQARRAIRRNNMIIGRRVLLVEDDREFADSIAVRCRSLGLCVETASTHLAAVVSMTARPPDLLCLDVNMPTGNGLDLCEYLISDADRPVKPVIVLTGRTDRETLERSRRLRTRYVRKSTDVWLHLRLAIMELLAIAGLCGWKCPTSRLKQARQ